MKSKAVKNQREKTTTSILPVYLCLLFLWASVSLCIRGFATSARIVDIFHTASFLGIVAVGQTMVILTGGIDISVSGVITLATAIVASALSKGVSSAWAILLTIVVCSLVGMFNAAGIFYLHIPPMLMTMATLSLIEGSLLLVTQGRLPSANCELITKLGKEKLACGVPYSVLIWAILTFLLFLLLNKNKFGRKVYGIGINERVAYLSGVQTRMISLVAYMLSAAFAGLAGILYLGYIGNSYITIGNPFQMDSITATLLGGTAIVGGRGNCLGTVAGVLIIVLLRDTLNVLNMPQALRDVSMGALIIILLLMYGREKSKN